MDRLPKPIERFLREIAPHSDEALYLKTRFEGLEYERANKEVRFVDCLIDERMIEAYDDTASIEYRVDRGHAVTLNFPTTFELTAYGECYQGERRRELARRAVAVVATAILGGVAANLMAVVVPWERLELVAPAETVFGAEFAGDAISDVVARCAEVVREIAEPR